MRDLSTLIDLVEGARDVHPARGLRIVSPRFRENYYSYAELYRRVLFQADHLRRQGIEPGQHVVVPVTTQIDVVSSFLALAWLGAVPVSVSGQMAGQDRAAYFQRIKQLIGRFRLDRLLVDRTLEEAAARDGSFDPRLTLDPYSEAVDPDREPPDVPPERPDPDDVAFIQFSSGSTSDPKGIQITHRNICHNLRTIVENDGRSEESSVVAWLPLYHDMGLVGCFLTPFVHYHPVILLHPVCFLMKPVTWLDYVSRYRCTTTAVPNFAVDMCNTRIRDHQLESRKPDLGSLEYVYDGSEPVSAEAIERFYERFEPYGLRRGVVHPVYGMAEATLLVTAPEPGESMTTRDVEGVKVVSVGRAKGGCEVRIADDEGRMLAPGMIGEVILKGPSLSPGYYQQEAENRRRFVDGWFRTGDLGVLDDEGRLYVTGRIKDLIIVNGKNFYAHDIAAKLEELPFLRRGKTHVFSFDLGEREEVVVMTVLESRMTSAIHKKLGELKTFLTSEQGSWLLGRLGEKAEHFIRNMSPGDYDSLKDGIKHFLLREFGLPIHDVFIVPSIPKTTSGKIRRSECEALYREYLESKTEPASD